MSVIDLPVTNGVVRRGRAVPTLLSYTFQDSGVTVQMHKMSPMTVQHINAAVTRECKALPPEHEHAYPQPPTQLIAVGGGEPIPQVNDGDVDYQRTLAAWQQWAAMEVSRRLMRIVALDYMEVDEGAIKEVVSYKRRMFKREGIPLDESEMPEERYTDAERDRVVYLEHVCYGSDTDMQEFAQFLMHRTQPQEAQIGDAIAAFRTAE